MSQREQFEQWFARYHEEACSQYGGIDCTNPKGIAGDAWEACAELNADLIERQSRDIAALMADNAEQVRISSEAVRSAINSRNLCRAQSYALLGVIEHVERGDGFDVMCLETVKRVYGVLAGRDDG